jgi:two-component system, NtrC family, C4-dicarboxylate transport sensor histidine kinase DctB
MPLKPTNNTLMTDKTAMKTKRPQARQSKQGFTLKKVVGAMALMLGFVIGLFYVCYVYFKDVEVQRAENRIVLYQSTLVEALERYQHLPFILAQDPLLRRGLNGFEIDVVNSRLEDFAFRSRLDAIYLMNTEGLTIAASNYASEQTFLGQNYNFRPYFQDAMDERRGEFFAIGATTSQPGYFIAEAVRDENGNPVGVLALKLDLTPLTEAWRAGGEAVFVANSDGVIVLSSDNSWRYQTLGALTDVRRNAIAAERQFGSEPLAPLDWVNRDNGIVDIDGTAFLHVVTAIPRLGWTLHFLADESRVRERALLVVVFVTIVAFVLLALVGYLRSRRLKVALLASQLARRNLVTVNTKLEEEIAERRATEARLERARSELARAGKLAALGQLAASVTHELGQPISAMRNYLTASEFESDAGAARLAKRLTGIVSRMENITKQLRFFAGPGEENVEEFDLRRVLDGALELVRHDLKHQGIEFEFSKPHKPVVIMGNRQQLEQVLVNLIRNAVSAMETSDVRKLVVEVSKSETTATLKVLDTGIGLGGRSIETLQEPFHTTKPSGEGMGLGLAISTAIVNEHKGTLSVVDFSGVESGTRVGVEFIVELPLAHEREDS